MRLDVKTSYFVPTFNATKEFVPDVGYVVNVFFRDVRGVGPDRGTIGTGEWRPIANFGDRQADAMWCVSDIIESDISRRKYFTHYSLQMLALGYSPKVLNKYEGGGRIFVQSSDLR